MCRFIVDENVAELMYPDAYTCYRSKTNPSTIDLALAKNVSVASSDVTELNPDHCPIEYVLKTEGDLYYEAPVPQFMYDRANWNRFKEIVDNKLSLGPLVDANDVDSSVDYLTEVIRLGMEESIPKKCYTSSNHFSLHLYC